MTSERIERKKNIYTDPNEKAVKDNNFLILFFLLLATFGLLVLKYFNIKKSSLLLSSLVLSISVILQQVWAKDDYSRNEMVNDWIWYTFFGFLVGMFADLIMNAVVRLLQGPGRTNINAMVTYFDMVHMFPSGFFAGLITALMVLHTVAISKLVGLSSYMPSYVAYAIIGFMVGALWGVVVEAWNAKAARKLMVFYKNTSGFTENRIWDGLSISLAGALAGVAVGLAGNSKK